MSPVPTTIRNPARRDRRRVSTTEGPRARSAERRRRGHARRGFRRARRPFVGTRSARTRVGGSGIDLGHPPVFDRASLFVLTASGELPRRRRSSGNDVLVGWSSTFRRCRAGGRHALGLVDEVASGTVDTPFRAGHRRRRGFPSLRAGTTGITTSRPGRRARRASRSSRGVGVRVLDALPSERRERTSGRVGPRLRSPGITVHDLRGRRRSGPSGTESDMTTTSRTPSVRRSANVVRRRVDDVVRGVGRPWSSWRFTVWSWAREGTA